MPLVGLPGAEKLDRSEVVLDSTKYALDRSARVLRGMTFWGKIQNAFSDDPQVLVGGMSFFYLSTAVLRGVGAGNMQGP